jgi:hypothetical protein
MLLVYSGWMSGLEFKKGYLTTENLERLNISIGINHSIIEDPIIFMLLGLNLFWLLVPRLVASVVAVHDSMGWHKLKFWLKTV